MFAVGFVRIEFDNTQMSEETVRNEPNKSNKGNDETGEGTNESENKPRDKNKEQSHPTTNTPRYNFPGLLGSVPMTFNCDLVQISLIGHDYTSTSRFT